MRVHFIAIGGSAMHNLAIALSRKGYTVTGSDDEIFEPALSRLKNAGILPEQVGWFPDKITDDLDAVILGMHAKEDNPELAKARETGIRIYSYPEYLYEQSKEKTRIVIGGSHGKTTITAMILHVMKDLGIDTDFMVGAQLEGFDVMVRLSNQAKYMVFEGDEYLTSPIDRRPKFHLYRPHIGLISGIAWDHINVFPTFENYMDQFRIFAEMIPEDGKLIYCNDDPHVKKLIKNLYGKYIKISYGLPDYKIRNGISEVMVGDKVYAMQVFGRHNMLNMEGARKVLETIGVCASEFYTSISKFKGASKRLELIHSNEKINVYKDFAHSPSKLKATIEAVKNQFPERHLVACMELHTFSSLNTSFLKEYKGCMDLADVAVVYYSKHALELKRLPYFDQKEVTNSFGREDIKVFNDKNEMTQFLLGYAKPETNFLMMSSGDYDGMKLDELSRSIIETE